MTYDRGAIPLLSPDGKRIVVNDRPVRGICNPRLFKSQGGVQFVEATDQKVRNGAIEYFASVEGMQDGVDELKEDGFVEAQRWSSDSKSLLIRISKTYSSGSYFVNDWLCLYSLDDGEFGHDLQLLNSGAVTKRE